jgi:hypothetical protein
MGSGGSGGLGLVEFELVPGRKGPLDAVVLVHASGEPLSFSEVLYILAMYFRAEDSYYPKPRFLGSDMLLHAIQDVHAGKYSIPEVCQKYKLDYTVRVR